MKSAIIQREGLDMLTIDQAFRDSVKLQPDDVALQYNQDQKWEHISYRDLFTAVNVTAYGMADLGIGKDTKVAIMSENRPEWAVCYLAAITTGAIGVPIDAMLGEVEAAHILNHSEADTIVCSLPCYEVVRRILSETDTLKNIILFDRSVIIRQDHASDGNGKDVAQNSKNGNSHKNFLSYAELRERGKRRLTEGEISFPQKAVTDITSIIYTSGTTGTAKGVMLTHKNIMSNVEAMRKVIKVNNLDNFLLLLPLHHAFPFTTCLALPMSCGSTVSFVDILSRDRTKLIMECQPTIILGVPLLYSKMFRNIMKQVTSSTIKNLIFKYGGKKIIGNALKKKLGGKVRLMVSGAAPIDPEIIVGFRSLGIEFLEGYGLTETSPVASVNLPGRVKIGSIGPAMSGIEIRIANPDDSGIGEILIKGDNVMLGYYKNPIQTKKVIKDGWFYSGDLGWMDEDGYVYITGRAKDVIVTRGGKNVYPDVVENEINKCPYILESIVMGYKTKDLVGEDVGVVVVPDYEALIELAAKEAHTFEEEIDLNDLSEDAKSEIVACYKTLIESEIKKSMEKLASFQRVTRIGIELNEFTKTSTRKIKRFLYKGRLDVMDLQ